MNLNLTDLPASVIASFVELVDTARSRLLMEPSAAALLQCAFESSLRKATCALERSIHTADFERLDVDQPGIECDGQRYRRSHRSPTSIVTLAGIIEVERTVYRQRGGHGGHTISPLALGLGLVDGWVTPAAAELMTRYTASVTPAEASHLLKESGGFSVSPSTFDRIAKVVGDCWERDRAELEEYTRLAELPSLPSQDLVDVITLSLDGVMIPMKDAPRTPGAAKEEAVPHGHKEASSATLTLYDKAGERLHTVRLGRMPESKKVVLQSQLLDELVAMLDRYPNARLSAVADAAKENERILAAIEKKVKRTIIRATDYFHATEHLCDGLRAAGAGGEVIQLFKETLLTRPDGAEDCLAELVQRRKESLDTLTDARREALDDEITYFNNNAHSMNYAALRAQNLPIGSGIQEAACKTLVVQRMKQSGMSWRTRGGQAILTMRALVLSNRFKAGWDALRPRFRTTFAIDVNLGRQKPTRLAA